MATIILLCAYSLILCLVILLTEHCLRRWKRTAGIAGKLRKYWLIPFLLLSALPVAGAYLPFEPLNFKLQAAGNIWLGFILYYGLIMLLACLLSAILERVSNTRVAHNWHGGILCLALGLTLALMGYGLVHAQHTLVNHHELTIDKPGEDMKVVLIGDLHLSVNSKLSTTQKMVELINAEQPDVVLVAGDIFTSTYNSLSHSEQYAEAIRGIQSKYGVYAVYGNHDVEEKLFGGFPLSPISEAFRSPEMEQFFDDCGFITLTDEVVTLENGVQIAGRIDGEKAGDGTTNRMSADELLSGADKSRPILVLQHEPDDFENLKPAGADAAFCGHTRRPALPQQLHHTPVQRNRLEL